MPQTRSVTRSWTDGTLVRPESGSHDQVRRAVTTAVPHDMRAATEAHHHEEQAGPEDVIQNVLDLDDL